MAGQNPGSPTDFQYFYEDEVYKINNSGQVVFGLVLENYEANSSDQESDVETPIQKGEIRVVWHPSGNERVISEKTVGLADRSLMPGDVVRRMIAGKDTQRGYCRDIMMTAALQIVGTNHVIPCVASERLDPLEEFTPDLAVCLDSWVGTSKAVHSKLRLTSADGSRLEWKFLDDCPLQDYTLRKRRTSSYSTIEYYPGQVLTGPVGSLDQAQWLNITKEMKAARKHKMHEHKFTVEAVVTESVGVHWQCRALCTTPGAENGAPQQPKFLVEGEDLKKLKLLNVFEPCTLQVGDRNFLTITEEDTFMTKKQWRKTQSKYYRELRRQTRPLKTTASKDSKTTLSNHSGELTTKHSSSHVPSKPKKRASFHSRDSSKVYPHGASQDCKQSHSLKEHVLPVVKMDVEKAQETVVSGSRSEIVCPSIKIDPSDDAGLQDLLQGNFGIANSTTDETALEEKNDSGISPEPAKEDTSLVNGDSKSGETQNPTLNDDDSENWENTSSDDGTDTDSGATWSSRCSSSAASLASAGARGGGKRSPQLAVKFLRGKRLKRAVKRAPIAPPPVPSARVVVETLYTTSKANVVWQDGTIELGIPSTQLYPIHHLDGQECFPGDFVVSGTTASGDDTQISHRDYGVVQKVDHHGRTAIVKWYRTYTSADQPVPQPIIETEVSVYDLKDHPDFQYRPGTVVIRVANFLGTEANCTAGQVIDNFPSGRVRVWWVDGHTSMCWPQDLYKVGEYDSEEGELWAEEGSGSEDSWETQSSGVASAARDDARTPDTLVDDARAPLAQADDARTPTGGVTPGAEPASGTVPRVPRLLEPRVAAHIERGRVAMHKLEEMFAHDPKLQNQEIMRKLLNLYKDCRFLDRLMGTTFFHEDNFLGLLERVREHGAATPTAEERRVQEQVTRLFTPATTPGASSSVGCGFPTDSKPDSDFPSAATTHNNLTGNTTITAFHVQTDPSAKSDETPSDVSMDAAPPDVDMTTILCKPMDVDVVDPRPIDAALTEIGGTLAKNKVCQHGLKIDIQKANNLDSSSEFVIMDNSSGTTSKGAESKGETSEEDGCSRNVCYKLCSLIHAQLVKVHAEVSRRRPALLAQFLNKLMTLPSASDEKLSYHFSVQYGALVVSLADAKNQKETELDKDACMRAFEQCIGVDSKSPVDNAASEDTTIVVAAEENTAEEKVAEQLPATNEVKEASLAELKTTVASTESLDEECPGEGFAMLESAPASHRFRLSMLQPSEPRIFYQAVKREIKLLKSDLPPMVWVRGYEDRIDLLSLMIGGPERTPYEDGLFLFDVQLGGEYPRAPPLCHYISYCTDRLNPNLYEDGKVCVSLLGTWSGRGVEVWGKDSSLLQVIVSLQGLILNSEPYFNEAGYEKHKGSQQGGENSRMYNEMAILKLVQSMTKLIQNPPEIFRREIITHFQTHALALCTRLDHWMKLSEQHNAPDSSANMDAQSALAPPDFPLIPASRGFCLTLRSSLDAFRATLQRTGIPL